jgi:uncharacterized membrane protein YeaQ/YmgE (transglycosylase-associated protein family)
MGLLSLLWAIVVGFVVGVLARWIFPGVVEMGFWLTTAIGIGGSLVGGLIGSLLSPSRSGAFRPAGLVMSVVGALLLIWAWLRYST